MLIILEIPLKFIHTTPNGSENAAAAICDETGRITIMMPHPERVFRTVQNSWHPKDWKERSPWMRMFENAREWIN